MKDEIQKMINDMADEFCRWPLPESVRADPIACGHTVKNRVGTNLLTVVEARQMFADIVAPKIDKLATEHAALCSLAKGANEDGRVLKLLVSAGYVTEGKVSEARAFLDERR
jgi:hypothetical protein